MLIDKIKRTRERHLALRKKIGEKLPDELRDEFRDLLEVTATLGWLNGVNQSVQYAMEHVGLSGDDGKGHRVLDTDDNDGPGSRLTDADTPATSAR